MNHEELVAAIDAVLEQFYRGQLSPYEALYKISELKGEHIMWKAGQQQ